MSPARPLIAACAALLLAFSIPAPAGAYAPGTGRLRIVHLDVGQGDGAVLISPDGEVAMIDNGPGGSNAMGVTVANQLKALGITRIEQHFISHLHSDHLGSTLAITQAGIPIQYAWDRGGTYVSTAYTNYVTAIGPVRRTLVKDQVITLDSLSAHPVRIKCVNLNGAGISTTDENSLSVMLKVSYGEFDMSFGGDSPGQNSGSYRDVETIVGPQVGPVEVYKVHHHGSATSSLDAFLNAVGPKIGVISCGNGNSYGHPTAAAVNRLHAHNVKTYWTELGTGATPLAGSDKVANGQITISATWEGAGVDTIRGNGFTDTFTNSGTGSGDLAAPVVDVLAPAGGETWKAGSLHLVTWSASDDVGVTTVDLAWSDDGGGVWNSIASGLANTGSFPWYVPSQATANGRVRVRARDAAGHMGSDSSATGFAVDFWTVTASAGPGGAITPSGVVPAAEGDDVAFTTTPLAGCELQDIVVDGGSVGPVGGYAFNGVAAYHTIAATFRDVAAPLITLASPHGGEQFLPGGTCTVAWSASDNLGVDSVDVDFSAAGPDGPWLALAHGLANSGTWDWTVPEASTATARVRVTAYDRARNAASAVSDSAFAIGASSAGVGPAGAAVFALAAPAPNPAGGPVTVRFSLAAEAPARVEVLDLQGRRYGAWSGVFGAGPHEWSWDGRGSSGERAGAGIYLVRLQSPQGTQVRRLVLLR